MSNACNIYRKAGMSSSFVIKKMDTHENIAIMIVKNNIYKSNQDTSLSLNVLYYRFHYTCTHKHHMYM